METQALSLRTNLRVWRDERLGRLWRVAYPEGGGETVVTFPDLAALSDFLAERLGLNLLDRPAEGELVYN